MKNFLHRPGTWLVVFGGVFLLTQDYLYTSWDASPSLLGLPNWLFWFMSVHVLFIGLFFLFIKKYWR